MQALITIYLIPNKVIRTVYLFRLAVMRNEMCNFSSHSDRPKQQVNATINIYGY